MLYFPKEAVLTSGSSNHQVQCGPFLLRLYDFADGFVLPADLPASLDKLPAFEKWAKASRTNASVLCNWDAELRRERGRASMEKYKALAAAAAAAAAAAEATK